MSSNDSKKDSGAGDSGPAPERGPDEEERVDAAEVPLSSLEERVCELEALAARRDEEAREANDRFLRARADLENYRKRVSRDQSEMAERIAGDTLAPILDVVDDVERALEDASTDASPLAAGVRLIRDKLLRLLGEMNVTPIEAAGARFDPNLHEAFGGVPSAGVEPDTIVREIRRGYRIGDRVLRPSRVLVALAASGGACDSAREPNSQ